jgi:hypothetical protein
MSVFLEGLFNHISVEELESIKDGLSNDRDTIYVIGMDNGLKYHIIAVIQYVATPSGAFITWLGV